MELPGDYSKLLDAFRKGFRIEGDAIIAQDAMHIGRYAGFLCDLTRSIESYPELAVWITGCSSAERLVHHYRMKSGGDLRDKMTYRGNSDIYRSVMENHAHLLVAGAECPASIEDIMEFAGDARITVADCDPVLIQIKKFSL